MKLNIPLAIAMIVSGAMVGAAIVLVITTAYAASLADLTERGPELKLYPRADPPCSTPKVAWPQPIPPTTPLNYWPTSPTPPISLVPINHFYDAQSQTWMSYNPVPVKTISYREEPPPAASAAPPPVPIPRPLPR